MALQLTYSQSTTGASYVDAYHRVDALYADRVTRSGRVEVGVYVSGTAAGTGKTRVDVIQFTFGSAVYDALDAPAISDMSTRVYEYLKTLSDYAGATDV